MRDELSSSGAYELISDRVPDIVEAHQKFLQTIKVETDNSLPFLYWLPKFHKNPVGHRFIAASLHCTLAELSKLLSDVLLHAMHTLRDKDDEEIRTSGLRRYWVVETYDEVSEFLGRWRHNDAASREAGLYTGDIATMYTAIPHTDLFVAIESATREAFDWAAQSLGVEHACIKTVGSGCCLWVRASHTDHTKESHTLSHSTLVELVKFLVSNTYLRCGDSLYRQTVGIPMGTNCAPVLANLFLYHYESAYVSRLLADHGPSVARSFRTCFRLIDDVLAVGVPRLHSALSQPAEDGGLYPRALALEQTSDSTLEAEFIGIHVEQKGSRFHLSVYDKRKSFPFKVRRYPLMASLIPRTIPYGVFVGLLHRGYRICSAAVDFLSYAVEVALILRGNGCAANKLKRAFKAFVAQAKGKYPETGATLAKRFSQMLGSKESPSA